MTLDLAIETPAGKDNVKQCQIYRVSSSRELLWYVVNSTITMIRNHTSSTVDTATTLYSSHHMDKSC